MATAKHLLSCDWGTTNFRLSLLEIDSGKCLGEVSGNDGIATVRQKRELLFFDILSGYLKQLAKQSGYSPEGLPLMISGMASSSLGIRELPYALLPFALDGSGTRIEKLETKASFPCPVWLVSGLSSEQDVMRGEETQLLGLANELTGPAGGSALDGHQLILFPGTHSKHCLVRGAVLVDFSTYMTGELFQLLSRQSVLRETVLAPARSSTSLSAGQKAAFLQAFSHPEADDLLHALFLTRTNYLMKKLNKRDNFYFLSGLLLAAELRNLRRRPPEHVILCGEGPLQELYELALRTLELPALAVLPAGKVRGAAAQGHLHLFRSGLLGAR